jgi:hypothetical protein
MKMPRTAPIVDRSMVATTRRTSGVIRVDPILPRFAVCLAWTVESSTIGDASTEPPAIFPRH